MNIPSTSEEVSMAHIKDYCYVTWDVDLTGKRLIDEICQIAACAPGSKFQQYIMPYRDIDVVAKKKHMIKTANVGKYRVLKDTRNGKVLKTKSELYALHDFIAWLEKLKEKSSGIILLNFENFKLAPELLIEALNRCKLYDRFACTVLGFINVYPFVKDKCSLSMSSYSLRVLSKILLNKDNEDISSACNRARLIYQILNHLCAGDSDDETVNIYNNVHHLFQSVHDKSADLCNFKQVLQLQRTLKPIFYPQFMIPARRKRATYLRRFLTNKQVDYETLKNLFSEGVESLESYISDVCSEPTDARDLVSIILNHFDHTNGNSDRKIRPNKKSTFRPEPVKGEENTNDAGGDTTEIVTLLEESKLSDNQC